MMVENIVVTQVLCIARTVCIECTVCTHRQVFSPISIACAVQCAVLKGRYAHHGGMPVCGVNRAINHTMPHHGVQA